MNKNVRGAPNEPGAYGAASKRREIKYARPVAQTQYEEKAVQEDKYRKKNQGKSREEAKRSRREDGRLD